MLTLTLPDGAENFDAAVFTQSGEFVMAGHREECELEAQDCCGLYCWIVRGRPIIRTDFERTE